MTILDKIPDHAKGPRVHIPLDDEVYFLSGLFHTAGFNLLAVGGVVRDYLLNVFHGTDTKKKDIDLVTDATPDQVIKLLESDKAWDATHKVHTIPVGEQFGVIMANVYTTGGKDVQRHDYEIATFREDSDTGDGRRPDSVTFSNIEEDSKRRDLTINALYYIIPDKPGEKGQVIDYHGGIEDVKKKRTKPVGKPAKRFEEDELRVMRLIRFFARLSGGRPSELESDPDIAKALRQFAAMPNVSDERIVQEFLSGLKSAIDPVNFLATLGHFKILDRMFPGLKINNNFPQLYRLRKDANMIRNPRIVLAFLLVNNDSSSVAQALGDLTYPVRAGAGECYKLVPNVKLLIDLAKFGPEKVYDLSKSRDVLRKQTGGNSPHSPKDVDQCLIAQRAEINAWGTLLGLNMNDMSNFGNFERSVPFTHPEIAGAGLQGPAIKDKMKELETQNFLSMTRRK